MTTVSRRKFLLGTTVAVSGLAGCSSNNTSESNTLDRTSASKETSTEQSTTENSTQGIETWNKSLGNNKSVSEIVDVEELGSGNIVATGNINRKPSEISVISVNQTGSLQWTKHIDFEAENEDISLTKLADDANPTGLVEAADGGVVIVGSSQRVFEAETESNDDELENRANIVAAKLSETGSIEWKKVYDSNTRDFAHSITQNSHGEYIITGIRHRDPVVDHPPLIMSIESSGELKRAKALPTSGLYNHLGHFAISDGFLLVGNSQSNGELAPVAIRLNKSYDVVWEKRYSDRVSKMVRSISEGNDGTCLIAGNIHIDFSTASIWFAKIDSQGNIQMEAEFESEDNVAGGQAVTQLSDGSYLVAGEVETPNKGSSDQRSYDVNLIRVNATGEKIGEQQIGGEATERINDLIQTSDDGVLFGGRRWSTEKSPNTDIKHPAYGWLVKTDTP